MRRTPLKAIREPAGVTDGQVPMWDATLGRFLAGDAVLPATTIWLPMTTTVGGEPQLLFTDDNELVLVEVPTPS